MKYTRLLLMPMLLLALSQSMAQNPVGYLRQTLTSGRDEVVAQRVETFAEMQKQSSLGVPKQFVVEYDESTGNERVMYYWDGFQSHANVPDSITGDKTFSGKVSLGSLVSQDSRDSAYWYGDSYTEGSFASAPYFRYTSLVCNWLGLKEGNRGVGGTTMMNRSPNISAWNMIARIGSIPQYSSRSKLISFAYGFNDTGVNDPAWTVENFIVDYTSVINAALSKGWPPQSILLISPWYRPDGHATATPARQKDFVNAVKSLSVTFGTKFVDAYNIGRTNGGAIIMASDNVHVDNSGYRIYANYIASIIGYEVKKNTQTLAASGVSEFSKVRYRNTDTLSVNSTILGIDSVGTVGRLVNKYIENPADTSKYSPSNLSISGVGKFKGVIKGGSNLLISGYGYFGGYINSINGAYPSTMKGLLLTGNGGNSYIDSYNSSTAGTAATLKINTVSQGPVDINGNVSVQSNKTLTVGTGVTIMGGGFRAFGGAYGASQGLMGIGTATIAYLDSYSGTTAGTATPLYFNTISQAAMYFGGNIIVNGSKTVTLGTGTFTTAGDVEITNSAKGFIQKDRGDGTRRRIVVTNGAITTEIVP